MRFSLSWVRKVSTFGEEPRRLRQWRSVSCGGRVREYFTASVRYSPSNPGRRELTCVDVQVRRSVEDIAVKRDEDSREQSWK